MGKVDNYVLGMDCGTTNIKAIILGEDGTVVAEAKRSSKVMIPGQDMNEQDANEWWGNAVSIFREITDAAGPGIVKKIHGISISSHTVTLLPVDSKGNPLRNALPAQDNRSTTELYYIVDSIGFEKFVSIVGGQPAVAFLSNKILWFKKNEPSLFSKTFCFLQASSFINYKLTGKMTMDIDQASRTQCLDINTMAWSGEIGSAIGVNLEEKLPKPLAVDEIIGYVTEEAAKITGLVAGIPVVAGCSDAMASMYATGISRLGEAGEASGTTSLVFIGSAIKSRPDIPVVTKPCAIDGIPWIFDAPIQTSGAALKWFADKFAFEEIEKAKKQGKDVFSNLNEMALDAKPGSNGLIFFPYLLGERAPLWNEYVRGMFIGLGMEMSRAELYRSVLEGTAYALRHVIETIRASGGKAVLLRICGGGAKNRVWSRIKASVLNMPVYLLDEKSGDVPFGDALIAGHKVGIFPDLTKTMEKLVKVNEIIQPIPEWSAVYDKLYPFYISMYRNLDSDLKNLRETINNL
jgi:xylulokinase